MVDNAVSKIVGSTELTAYKGDIVMFASRRGAIVNAANENMRGGGGVDGAVHRAAGPLLLAWEEFEDLICGTGSVQITPGFELSVPIIIHTVGPRYNRADYLAAREENYGFVGSDMVIDEYMARNKSDAELKKMNRNLDASYRRQAARQLKECYTKSIGVADALNLEEIAFPAISTGIFGYPLEAATKIAIESVIKRLTQMKEPTTLKKVHFICFDDRNLDVYKNELAKI